MNMNIHAWNVCTYVARSSEQSYLPLWLLNIYICNTIWNIRAPSCGICQVAFYHDFVHQIAHYFSYSLLFLKEQIDSFTLQTVIIESNIHFEETWIYWNLQIYIFAIEFEIFAHHVAGYVKCFVLFQIVPTFLRRRNLPCKLLI